MQTLKSCPFCGGTPKFTKSGGDDDRDGYAVVHKLTCDKCFISLNSMSKPFTGPTEKEAIDKIINKWNTRAAAPVEGLRTVGVTYLGMFFPLSKKAKWPKTGNELVTRSQAEAIIAAKDARIEDLLKTDLTNLEECNCLKMQINQLEADNAALTARVKELEADIKTHVDGTTELVNEKVDAEFKAIDLETQLAAARKALYSIAHTFTEGSHGNMKCLPASDYQAIARAALEVKNE